MPKSTNRDARLAAGSILRASKNMKAKIDEAVDDATNAATVAAVKNKENERYAKNAILAAITLAALRLSHSIQTAVMAGRQEARDLGAARLASELAAAGVVVSIHDLATWDHKEDETRSQLAGAALSSAWLSAVTFSALKALREDEDVVVKMARAKLVMASRAEKTSETEAATALNAERRDGLSLAAAENETLAARLVEARLGKRWDAQADACHLCAPFDGTVVGINEDFPGGEPGWMHIRCLCVYTIVPLSEADAA